MWVATAAGGYEAGHWAKHVKGINAFAFPAAV